MTDPWGIGWMFMETRDGKRGSLRAIEYADPPVAFVSCPNHCYRVPLPDNAADDGPAWVEGDLVECSMCGHPDVPVIGAFWHEPFALIEWYKEAGAADYVKIEMEDGGQESYIRPVILGQLLEGAE